MLKERKLIYLFNFFGLDLNIQQNYEMKRMHLKEILFRKDAGKSKYPAGKHRKSLEKIRKISGRNTASAKSPELSGTGRFRSGLFDLGR
jgi:hypothetical protein